jgi:hypothetical protein
MLHNLIDNPFHFFHLIYFEDFINVLKKDYHTKRIYFKEISSSSNFEDVTNETEYINSIFQHFRKAIVNKILQDVSSLNEAEAEEYVHNIFSLLNNYKEKNKLLRSKEDYTNEVLNEIKSLIEFIQINYKDLLDEIEIKKNTQIYFNTGCELTPFKFLEDLLFTNGFERLKKSFGYKTIHTKNHYYVFHSENGYFFESWLLKYDISSQMDFDKYFVDVTDFYAYAGLEIIDNKQSDINFKQYLHNQLEKLYTYYLKKEDLRGVL